MSKIFYVFWTILIILVVVALFGNADLSDETLEIVEDLRWKHYPCGSQFFTQPDIEWWAQQYPYIKFEDGILYIVDKDVTWFVEMEKVKNGD